MLPYSMPHPYAYNCAPDHTRSFLEPVQPLVLHKVCSSAVSIWDPGLEVRQRNNADQIFGGSFASHL